jgi:hypothetical protein
MILKVEPGQPSVGDWQKIVAEKRATRDEAVRPWLTTSATSYEQLSDDRTATAEIEELVDLMRKGTVSAEDVARAHIRRYGPLCSFFG